MNDLPEQQSTIKTQQIRSLALQVGFDECGVSRADYLFEHEYFLKQWLCNDYLGEMGYMERSFQKRLDPRLLVPNAKSIISAILNYNPGNPSASTIPPKISRYALSRDYHAVLKDKVYQLFELIKSNFGSVNGRVFVDSAPILEKAWAEKAGLGWIGKNSLLLNPKFGSYFFIGELIVDLEIEPSEDLVPNKCGSCQKCIDTCPTGAIISPKVIDSKKCISYLTIEKKTDLTEAERNELNGWCFGCDICQEVCPWNKHAPLTTCEEIKPKNDIVRLSSDLKALSKEQFEAVFKETPMNRINWKKFSQNLLSVDEATNL